MRMEIWLLGWWSELRRVRGVQVDSSAIEWLTMVRSGEEGLPLVGSRVWMVLVKDQHHACVYGVYYEATSGGCSVIRCGGIPGIIMGVKVAHNDSVVVVQLEEIWRDRETKLVTTDLCVIH